MNIMQLIYPGLEAAVKTVGKLWKAENICSTFPWGNKQWWLLVNPLGWDSDAVVICLGSYAIQYTTCTLGEAVTEKTVSRSCKQSWVMRVLLGCRCRKLEILYCNTLRNKNQTKIKHLFGHDKHLLRLGVCWNRFY